MEWLWIGSCLLSTSLAWWSGRYFRLNKEKALLRFRVPRDYLIGINFLLNDETDKAVDIFIKMLEVDSNTVETHWAVGKLFRRRGEVDRAIRIHQNLIARPQLDKVHREQSLYELGQDYLSIGMLDRAERIFLELIHAKSHAAEAWRALIDIYQQGKDWERAIYAATHYGLTTKQKVNFMLAHYHCELAELAYADGKLKQVKQSLAAATLADHTCVRTNLLHAKIQIDKQDYQSALSYLKQVQDQDPDYLSEAVEWLVLCYQELNKPIELINYLTTLLQHYPCTPVVLVLTDYVRKCRGESAASDLVADYVRKYPSLRGLYLLIDLYVSDTGERRQEDLYLLKSLIKKLLTDKSDYQCRSCGFSGKSLHWQCPGCKRWSTIKPIYDVEEGLV